MFGLALRSLRYRARRFVAGFVVLSLGATILMSFGSLVDTRTGPGIDANSQTTLLIMASVVGGWGLVIVLSATVSTLTLLARQRAGELALLRSVGATPAQLGRMMAGEAVVLAVIAAAVAVVPSMLAGRMIVGLLADAHQVPAGVPARFGWFAVGIGFGAILLAAVLATVIVTARMTRTSVADATRTRRPRTLRAVAGSALLAAGISCGVTTLTAFSRTDPALMAVAAEGSILCAIGFGVLAPWLLTGTVRLLGALLRRLGVAGWLTTLNLAGRVQQAAGAVTPVILFTGIATGTLYMQGIENATPGAKNGMDATVETLNYVVVGMIAVFTAIMVVNTLVAATADRRREFGQLRLAGSTPPQVLGLVSLESITLVALGVLAGTIASLATVIPYGIARTGSALPDTSITVYLGVVATATVLTLSSALTTTHHVTRRPAIQAAQP